MTVILLDPHTLLHMAHMVCSQNHKIGHIVAPLAELCARFLFSLVLLHVCVVK